MSSYKREYELIYTAEDGKVLKLTQTAEKMGLMIDFNINKSRTDKPNQATIGITNPGKATIAHFQKTGVVELSAGYKGDIALILAGDKQSMSYTHDGGTQRLELNILEGSAAYDKLIINKSYSFGSTTIDIVNDLTQWIKENIPSVSAIDPYILIGAKSYLEPQVISGIATELLTKFLAPLKYEYYIDKGLLTILPMNGYTRALQVDINNKTGMVGSPKPIMDSGADKKALNGIEVTSILNYNLDVGRLINVTSNETKGVYRIQSVSFVGNSFEGDWLCNVKAYDI
jgi:hypothetical protein